MKLKTFQITNFRSINDSGPVTADKVTSLVGRNESGKSNLLLALRTLNPPGGPVDLNRIKDFPRHRRLSECTDDTPVVSTTWELDATEQAELSGMFPRASGITHVNIGRDYKASTRWVGFVGLKYVSLSAPEVCDEFALVLSRPMMRQSPPVQSFIVTLNEIAPNPKLDLLVMTPCKRRGF
jgi:hypothetical protein